MPNGQIRACEVTNTDGTQIEADPNKMEGDGQYGWQGRVFKARNQADQDGHIPADNTARGRFLNVPHESERHQNDDRGDRYQDDGYQDDWSPRSVSLCHVPMTVCLCLCMCLCMSLPLPDGVT